MATTRRKLETGAEMALTGSVLNAVLCVAKIGLGILGHSYALIADGFESLLDILSSLLIWAGLKYAARPADVTHPYGHGKAEPMAAILGALMIMGAAAALSVESIRALPTRHSLPASYTLAVLVVIIIVKEVHSRRVQKLARETDSVAMQADAVHHRTDAITSASALVGITISILGGPRFAQADSWAALFACAIIGYNGILIFIPSLRDLMDTAPSNGVEEQVRDVARMVPGVIETERCRIRKMGLEYYVELHVRVDGAISVTAGHEIAHQVKDAIRRAAPEVADVLVHIEPSHPIG